MNYFDIIDKIKQHFENDPLINTVTQGDIFDVDLNKQTIFPLCHIIVNQATFENNVIRFKTSRPMESLAKLNRSGLRFHSIKVQTANLEDVFLNLTGRRLRD